MDPKYEAGIRKKDETKPWKFKLWAKASLSPVHVSVNFPPTPLLHKDRVPLVTSRIVGVEGEGNDAYVLKPNEKGRLCCPRRGENTYFRRGEDALVQGTSNIRWDDKSTISRSWFDAFEGF